jgi:adenylosuccinate lyase
LLACEAMAELGQIPKNDAAEIRKRARFSIPEIVEIEKRTNHDVIAFLENVAASVGPAARWIHQGLTSSDILDTTLAVQLMESIKLLADDLKDLRSAVAVQARRFKMTPMIGRSLMFDEFGRAEERLAQMGERIRVGKISGAVGTHAHVDPKVERSVCEKLGLRPATLSTQIVQRDRHAEFLTTLAVIASSIDRWATEFRHLQRTEVLEVEEFFGAEQKGSSAMPHKRNPITSERLSGLARVIRGNSVVALENVALWHERDISHSSAERIILPDSCILLDYMLTQLRTLVERLQVYPERMQQNLALTRGLYFSQSILLALTRAGMERKSAYEAVQRAAMKTWKGDGTLAENLKREPEIMAKLSGEEIDRLCSLDVHFQHVDATFKALGLE